LFECLAEEFDIDFLNAGSVPLREPAVRAGFEPDTCFYVTNLDRVKGSRELELPHDPAPDLVIEVDISRSSAWKLRVYGVLGIREAWRFTGGGLKIYALSGEEHREAAQSGVLPAMAIDLSELVQAYDEMKPNHWRRHVREWAASRKI
jgi:Uma2 family endonuclease